MRLSEAKIKEAILHPEKMAREEALQYFTDCYSRDVEVMPLAIKAIETYGRSNAFFIHHDMPKLAQTESTVEWAIRELHHEKNKADEPHRFSLTVSSLLCSADPKLTIPRAEDILHAPGFLKSLIPAFRDRQQLASWDAERCWKELESISAKGVGEKSSSNVDFSHASRVVEALAPQSEKYVERILGLLDKKVEDYDTDPMGLMEIFLVELAGEMRLEPAIPLIVKKLREDGDFLLEEGIEALGKIGTDAAAEAITEGWLEASWDYRLYATTALEYIHSETTVRKCLELLPQDKDLDIRTKLADALLSQFADEGIEPIREIVQREDYDPMDSDLMRKLVAVSTVLGVNFPEYPIWKQEVEERRVAQERKMKKMDSYIYEPPPTLPKSAPTKRQADSYEPRLTPILRTEEQVGRNDPCPCGSGKKFKKCCMGKNKN